MIRPSGKVPVNPPVSAPAAQPEETRSGDAAVMITLANKTKNAAKPGPAAGHRWQELSDPNLARRMQKIELKGINPNLKPTRNAA
ncbi:MAG TPA: hypothetical protein VJ112_00915 [Rhabdochlamydiaceae bacterium]|nr:hypothetical protein [Rhabdochlamydiaceae bacterium]